MTSDSTGMISCPFCDGKFEVTTDGGRYETESGQSLRNMPVVVHTVPSCRRFDELEAFDFVVAARQRIEVRRLSMN